MDSQVIDETSVRGEDSVWQYRDPRMQRVANALIRAEHPLCAHRNRPLRYDGRVVVTLCADEVLYLSVTTEITSLPQLTPEGLPLALARRAAEETRMTRAAAELEAHGEAVTSRALAATAHISREHRMHLAAEARNGRQSETTPMLSVLHYSSSSVSDNTPALETQAVQPTPSSAECTTA